MEDIGEKTDEVKDQIRQRQSEINEMKRNIQDKANKGEMLQQEVDRIGGGNRQMEQ